MPIVRTTVVIPAPPAAVWAVLTDTAAWSAWNPVQPGLDAPLEAGARGRVAIRVGGRTWWPRIRMVAVEPERTLSWVGGIRGVFHAIHGFDLQPVDGGTRVTHAEAFSGLVPTLAWDALHRRLDPRYRAVNQALHDRVVAQSAPGSGT